MMIIRKINKYQWSVIVIVFLIFTQVAYTQEDDYDCGFRLVESVAWHPNRNIIAVGGAGGCYGVHIFSNTLEFITTISSPHITNSYHLSWSPDGRYLAISDNDYVLVWDYEEQEELLYLEDMAYPVTWHPNSGQIAFRSSDQSKMYTYDLKSDDLNTVPYTPEFRIQPLLTWTNDGSNIFFIDTNFLMGWNIETNEIEQTSSEPFSAIWWQHSWNNRWNPDKTAMFVHPDRPYGDLSTVGIWYFQDDQVIISDQVHLNASTGISWSPDGKYIAVSNLHSLIIFDSTDLEILLENPYNDLEVDFAYEFNTCPNGRNMRSNLTVVTWNQESDRVVLGNPCGLMIIPIEIP